MVKPFSKVFVFIVLEKVKEIVAFTGTVSFSCGVVNITVGAKEGIISPASVFEGIDSFQYLSSIVAE